MTETEKLKGLRLHERMEVSCPGYVIFVTKVMGGFIYTYLFPAEHPHSSSVFVPFLTNTFHDLGDKKFSED